MAFFCNGEKRSVFCLQITKIKYKFKYLICLIALWHARKFLVTTENSEESLQKNQGYLTLFNNDRFVQISMLVQEMGKFLNCSFVLLKIGNYLKLYYKFINSKGVKTKQADTGNFWKKVLFE